jgi:hypothetical protein
MTLSGGVRLDMQNESTAGLHRGHRTAGCRTATRATPKVKDVPNWKDFNPRVAVAYDVLGNGKTALKASASRGVEQDSIRYAGANNPASTLVTQTARAWTDSNQNFVPDCESDGWRLER